MPLFSYKAKRGPKEVVEGELEVGSETEAIKALDALGLVPVSILPKKNAPAAKSEPKTASLKGASRRGVKRKHVNEFIRSLADLVKGNVPILKALSLLASQSPAGMKEVVSLLANDVKQGAALSQAMERHADVFPPLLIGMVRGGESAGVLGEMLEKTADHEEKMEEMRRKIRGAMAYPLFVLAMGGITIFILLVYFMPGLMETYSTGGQILPWPTRATLAVGDFLSKAWYWILGLILLVTALIRRRGESSFAPWDRIKLQLPLIKSLVQKSSVVNFSRTLGLLIAHGVPIAKGVALASQTVGNRIFAARLAAIEEKLTRRGSSLGAALREVPDYPPHALSLVTVGEESGNLALSLGQVANQYEREVEAWLKTSTTLIEPTMILLVGGIIGFVVFAMLMPIFQMDVLMG